ncbi:hypothetical protein NIES4101_50740 [Calothrix sp. NIES-4101]|nr:hypothetical protein NIES4101_50740 [Calothrix sp. NIES-4101]
MIKKILLPTVAISGSLLACFGLLLATQGSKLIEVQFENEKVFYGELKDVVTPPVGALLSFGLGLGVASVFGWRQSVKKTWELENQIIQIQNQISSKDAQIQELKVAPSSPMLAQVEWFLDENKNVTSFTGVPTSVQKQQVVTVQPPTKPLVNPMSGFDYQQSSQNTAQNPAQ